MLKMLTRSLFTLNTQHKQDKNITIQTDIQAYHQRPLLNALNKTNYNIIHRLNACIYVIQNKTAVYVFFMLLHLNAPNILFKLI